MAHQPHVYFPQVYVMPVLLGLLLPLDVPPTAQLSLELQHFPPKKEDSLFLDLPPLERQCFNCQTGSSTSSNFQEDVHCLRQPAPFSGHGCGSVNMAHQPHVYFPQVYVMPVLLGLLLPLDVPPTAQLSLELQHFPPKKEDSLFLDLPPLEHQCFQLPNPDRQRHQIFKRTYTVCSNRHLSSGHGCGSVNMAHQPHVYFPQVYVMPVLLGLLLPLDVPPTAQLSLELQHFPPKKEDSLFLDLPPLERQCFNCQTGSSTSSNFQEDVHCLRQPAPFSGHGCGSVNMAHQPHVYFPQVYVMPVLLGLLLPLDVPPTAQLSLELQHFPPKKEDSLFLDLPPLERQLFQLPNRIINVIKFPRGRTLSAPTGTFQWARASSLHILGCLPKKALLRLFLAQICHSVTRYDRLVLQNPGNAPKANVGRRWACSSSSLRTVARIKVRKIIMTENVAVLEKATGLQLVYAIAH
ncbi:hypothetical protein MTO96_038507 [Rhipicephalus appendiculatus]